ncbi:F-box protein At4g19940-like [Cornus florida]|uniref:F-box protein At4g19940-like n=1 Tax=Cornus florida TaxID=4283 RepID=UPI0028968DDB|nr:F-box protein At4g19940-like [Cornus florida]
MENNSYVHHVQEDVVIEVLLKLPVKSLLRFKCVCKYWFNLVKNCNFISKHLHQKNHKAYLLIERYSYSTHIFSCALLPLEMLTNRSIVYLDINDPDTAKYISVIDSFNGIICLWDQNQIALWNPTIREFKPLPVYHPILPLYIKAYSHCFGFGLDLVTNNYKVVWIRYLWNEENDYPYDPPVVSVYNLFPLYIKAYSHCFGFGLDLVTNNYKVVWIRYLWNEENDYPYDPPVVSVYNLGIDSWRLVEADLRPHLMRGALGNTCTNGIYYWLVSHGGDNYLVLSFDMKNEVFKMILAPLDIHESQLGTLGLYNESIAMVLFDPCVIEKQFDIWVMVEEGYWTKQLIIGPISDVDGPLGCAKNGEFLFYTGTSQLVVYSPNTQEIKYLGPCRYSHSLSVFVYEESLASIKGEKECLEGVNTLWSELKCFSCSISLS